MRKILLFLFVSRFAFAIPELIHELSIEGYYPLSSPVFSQDETQVAVLLGKIEEGEKGGAPVVRIYDVISGTKISHWNYPGRLGKHSSWMFAGTLIFSADGKKIVVGTEEGEVKVFEASGGKLLFELPEQSGPIGSLHSVFSTIRGEQILLVSGTEASRLHSLKEGKLIFEFDYPPHLTPNSENLTSIWHGALNANGTLAADLRADGWLRLYDLITGTEKLFGGASMRPAGEYAVARLVGGRIPNIVSTLAVSLGFDGRTNDLSVLIWSNEKKDAAAVRTYRSSTGEQRHIQHFPSFFHIKMVPHAFPFTGDTMVLGRYWLDMIPEDSNAISCAQLIQVGQYSGGDPLVGSQTSKITAASVSANGNYGAAVPDTPRLWIWKISAN